MPNTLFIRPVHLGDTLPDSEKKYEWAIYDVAGNLLKHGTKASLDIIDQTLMQNAFEHVDIIGLFPTQSALSTLVSVPGNQTRYIQQALPFAVEDQIAQDIDEVHLVLGDKTKSAEFNVTCIAHSLFSEFFDALNDEEMVGVLKAIHLDSHLFGADQQGIRIILSETTAMIIQPSGQVACVQAHNLIAYLDCLLLKNGKVDAEQPIHTDPQEIEIIVEKSGLAASQMIIAEIQQYPNITVSLNELDQSVFEYGCSEYFKLKKSPINLCQGPYQLSSRSQGAWYRWRSVAMIAGLGFLLQLGVFIGQGIYMEKQAEMVASEALKHYQAAVPGVKNISVEKLPRIIKGQLNQLNAQGKAQLGFLDLLGEAGFQFNINPNKSSMAFSSINFSAQRGELLLEMHAKSFEQLESLKKAIVEAGLNAKISSAVQEKDYFKGRISVGGA